MSRYNFLRTHRNLFLIIVFCIFPIMQNSLATTQNLDEIRASLSPKERAEFDAAMEELEQIAKSGNYTTNNPEDKALAESYRQNLLKRDQLKEEYEQSKERVELLERQLAWLKEHADAIDKAVNDEVIREIMRAHPELRTKAAVFRYISSHRGEADAIAARVGEKYNPFEGGKPWLLLYGQKEI